MQVSLIPQTQTEENIHWGKVVFIIIYVGYRFFSAKNTNKHDDRVNNIFRGGYNTHDNNINRDKAIQAATELK